MRFKAISKDSGHALLEMVLFLPLGILLLLGSLDTGLDIIQRSKAKDILKSTIAEQKYLTSLHQVYQLNSRGDLEVNTNNLTTAFNTSVESLKQNLTNNLHNRFDYNAQLSIVKLYFNSNTGALRNVEVKNQRSIGELQAPRADINEVISYQEKPSSYATAIQNESYQEYFDTSYAIFINISLQKKTDTNIFAGVLPQVQIVHQSQLIQLPIQIF